MAEFKFGFEESWFRLITKKLPDNPDLFLPKAVEKAQDVLRVGKLKVGAARAWAESAGIVCKKKGAFILTPLGSVIARHDPDLEEDGIWWVLHYNLARTNSPAWFYSFYFNDFDADKFIRDEFEKEVRDYWDNTHEKPMTDSVFHKLIFSPLKQVFEGTRLGDKFGFWIADEDGNYLRQPQNSPSLPKAILAYALLDWGCQQQRQSVHLDKLLESGGIGKIFKLERNVLDSLLIDVGEFYQKQVAWISHTAGLNSVSIMDVPPLALISAYYHELDGAEPMAALTLGKEEVERFVAG
ncbi:MAG: DUF4007 family protein [Pseudomonadota bacterium]|nr:DUF4007 family protein [Pseudomonadota bacterium]